VRWLKIWSGWLKLARAQSSHGLDIAARRLCLKPCLPLRNTMRLPYLAPFLRLACNARRMVLPASIGDVLEAVAPEMTAEPSRLLGFHPRAIVGCQRGRIGPVLLSEVVPSGWTV